VSLSSRYLCHPLKSATMYSMYDFEVIVRLRPPCMRQLG
jgi:hypothetical protein